MPTSSVVEILTAAIAPVIVISGAGMLQLSISNRYGRVIDRARALIREHRGSDPSSAEVRHLRAQLLHTHQRARILRRCMICGSASIFFVSLTVLALFVEGVIGLHRDLFALPFFAMGVVTLVVSIHYSIRDITVSLAALEMEISSADAAQESVPPGSAAGAR